MRLILLTTLAAVCVNSLEAQTPPVPTPRPVQPPVVGTTPAVSYPNTLYQIEEIRQTLSLTPEQLVRLDKINTATRDQYRDNFSKLANLSEKESLARQQELDRQYEIDWTKAARDVFNENQWKRYQQLNYQYRGFNNFNDPDVQKRLNLTAEQIKALREEQEWNAQQLLTANQIWREDRAQGDLAYNNYLKQREERFQRYLTEEQRKIWREMTGDQFRFTPEMILSLKAK